MQNMSIRTVVNYRAPFSPRDTKMKLSRGENKTERKPENNVEIEIGRKKKGKSFRNERIYSLSLLCRL